MYVLSCWVFIFRSEVYYNVHSATVSFQTASASFCQENCKVVPTLSKHLHPAAQIPVQNKVFNSISPVNISNLLSSGPYCTEAQRQTKNHTPAWRHGDTDAGFQGTVFAIADGRKIHPSCVIKSTLAFLSAIVLSQIPCY